MKGMIITNPFGYPENSLLQAKRIRQEFINFGIDIPIVNDACLKVMINDCKIVKEFADVDFAIYLDKDKYLSSILTKLNIRLFNSHNSIRVCDDKGETCLALINNCIPMPKTMFAPLCYNQANKLDCAEKIISRLSLPVIVKESYGSMGCGVYKANTPQELACIIEKLKMKPHIYQEYMGSKKGVDVRVIVIGGKTICAMERFSETDFRSNIGQGGKGRKIILDKSFSDLAEKCANILELDYCGVDLLYDEKGNPCVCEVNSNAFFDGIEKVTGVNVAKAYVEYIISNMNIK